jgi:hypothetical protein
VALDNDLNADPLLHAKPERSFALIVPHLKAPTSGSLPLSKRSALVEGQ